MTKKSKIEAVIFDMDGVLLDTESVCYECWLSAGSEFGILNVESLFRSCVGQNKGDTLLLLSKTLGSEEKARDFYERTGEFFSKIERERGLQKMDGVDFCLSLLKQNNIRLAVASSTRREAVERQLRNAGIFDYFESVTTGDLVEHSKPAPDIYLRALSSLNVDAKQCISVEDSPNGIRASCAARIRCVMVPDQIAPDDEIKKSAWKIVSSLKEIPEIVL